MLLVLSRQPFSGTYCVRRHPRGDRAARGVDPAQAAHWPSLVGLSAWVAAQGSTLHTSLMLAEALQWRGQVQAVDGQAVDDVLLDDQPAEGL